MDMLLKLVHMFNATAAMFAGYIPQNKEEVLELLKKGFSLLGGLNIWLGSVLGIDIQKIINICIQFIIKYISLAFNFLIEVLKKLSESV
ncbi:MAG: hypothetical protein ACYC3G_03560 [Minisyncoccota bacterium]